MVHIPDVDEFITITLVLVLFDSINVGVTNYFMRKSGHNVYF